VYSAEQIRSFWERIECPNNDRVCQEAVWLGQTTLLGDRQDMEHIVGAISKIQQHAESLAKI